MRTIPTLGIDIAHRTFVAALRFSHQQIMRREFENHKGGFRLLHRWLKTHCAGQLRVGLESTNTYAEALALALHDAGHEVHLFNPERVACYARSQGQRNKTDPADAAMIAAFVAQHTGTPWHPPAPEQKTLRSLTRTRQQLIEVGKQLANQLRTAEPAAQSYLQETLKALHAQLKVLERDLKAHLKAHPALAELVRRLMTVKGLGLTTAAVLIAELPPITADTDPRTIAAWAGLTPSRQQSGRTELPAHLSRKGNAYLRNALFMPSLVAKRYNPLLRSFAARLAAAGKRHGAILGAIAHKLLRICVGLLRTNSDFNPTLRT